VQLHQQREPATVVVVRNIPVTPAGLTSPLCLRVPCKAPCYPASCFPQVLSTDRGYKGGGGGGRETNRQTSSHLTECGSLGFADPRDGCLFSARLQNSYLLTFTGSAVTNCLATTPGIIIIIIIMAQENWLCTSGGLTAMKPPD